MENEREVAEVLSVIMRDDFCGNIARFGNKVVLRFPNGETFSITVEKV